MASPLTGQLQNFIFTTQHHQITRPINETAETLYENDVYSINPSKPSGYFTYHQFKRSKILQSVHTAHYVFYMGHMTNRDWA